MAGTGNFKVTGYATYINKEKVVAVVPLNSRWTKRMLKTARETDTLIDLTEGRLQRTLIIFENGYVAVCSGETRTLVTRWSKGIDTIRGSEETVTEISTGDSEVQPVCPT
jgi:regulator of extracellular matrix RemA (YlzA/DUF370 family)